MAHATPQPSLINQHVQENLRKVPLAYMMCRLFSFELVASSHTFFANFAPETYRFFVQKNVDMGRSRV